MGPNARNIVIQRCETLTGLTPSLQALNLPTAFSNLRAIFGKITETIKCSCRRRGKSWKKRSVMGFLVISTGDCRRCTFWIRISLAISTLFWSLFVDVKHEVAVPQLVLAEERMFTQTSGKVSQRFQSLAIKQYVTYLNTALGFDNSFQQGILPSLRPSEIIQSSIMTLFCGSNDYSDVLASGPGNLIILPSSLISLELSPEPIRFEALQGCFMVNQNSYTVPKSATFGDEQGAPEIIGEGIDLVPSSIGSHSRLLVTIRERFRHLELKAVARVGG